jgi:hypothetical protein
MLSHRPELRLDWCSHEAAKYACERWHYSKCISVGRQNFVGVWEDNKFIGSIVFARSSSTEIGTAYGCTQWTSIELSRVALKSHETSVSRILTIATRMLRARNPGLRIVISFADPGQGHHGGIYQACGWIYVGTSAPRRQFHIRGKWRTDTHAWRMRTDATPSRRVPGKHKYLLPLDADMRDRIAPLSQPYPKRVKQATDGRPPFSGGAAPTHTLQPMRGLSHAA